MQTADFDARTVAAIGTARPVSETLVPAAPAIADRSR